MKKNFQNIFEKKKIITYQYEDGIYASVILSRYVWSCLVMSGHVSVQLVAWS